MKQAAILRIVSFMEHRAIKLEASDVMPLSRGDFSSTDSSHTDVTLERFFLNICSENSRNKNVIEFSPRFDFLVADASEASLSQVQPEKREWW